MVDNPNQPRKYDAVLGNQPPSSSAVLGGLEGVKRRLVSPSEQQRIAGLKEALKYGDIGFHLVIQTCLQDASEQVQQTAFRLLHQQKTLPRVKQALENCIPLNSAVGIDYTRLRDLLAAEKWQEGDRETLAVMLKACFDILSR